MPRSKGRTARLLVFLVLAIAAGIGFKTFGSELTLEKLATRESAFRQFQEAHPVLVYLLAVSIYVSVTGLSLPGATPLSLLIAWLFGFWRALILVSFSSTAGATVAFLLSRYLFRELVSQRFGDRLEIFNNALKRDGAFYLLSLRLMPIVPFFVINAVMGLTPVRTRTFWFVSQLGMLPGTAVYVYAGSRVPSLQSIADRGINAVFTTSQMTHFFSAFILLALFPLVVRRILKQSEANWPAWWSRK